MDVGSENACMRDLMHESQLPSSRSFMDLYVTPKPMHVSSFTICFSFSEVCAVYVYVATVGRLRMCGSVWGKFFRILSRSHFLNMVHWESNLPPRGTFLCPGSHLFMPRGHLFMPRGYCLATPGHLFVPWGQLFVLLLVKLNLYLPICF